MPIEKIGDNKEKYFYSFILKEIPKVNPIDFEIIKNRLNTIANEMGAAVHSTAHSLLFSEAKDFACALFDSEGKLVGMGEFMPGHQGAMQSNVDGIIAAGGLELFGEGDVLMSNDPVYGASHPPDLMLFHPVYQEHELIGIAGCTVHHVDMGGAAPSSWYPLATDLYQEGIRFPPGTKLYEAGKLRKDILNIFLTNVRVPDTQRGDLMAQVASCHLGARRMCEIAQKYGTKLLKDICLAIQHSAAKRIHALIEQMPDGVYVSEDFVDDDGHDNRSFRVKCTMTVTKDRLLLDFTGTEKQAKGFINSHWGITSANCYSPLMSMDPECPRCWGAMTPVEIIAEKGTLVNAGNTAPMMASTTEVGQAVHNVVWHCLSQANPRRGSGIWTGSLDNIIFYGMNMRNKKFTICNLTQVIGGGGARQSMDGWPVAHAKAANTNLPNIEVHEAYWPIIYKFRRIVPEKDVPGSGAGTYRGGAGMELEVSPLDGPLKLQTRGNHVYHPTAGVFGGLGGHPGCMEIRDARTGESKKRLRPKGMDYILEPGKDSLFMRTPGGGGYGLPAKRDPAKVKEDVLEDFVAPSSAKTAYGVEA